LLGEASRDFFLEYRANLRKYAGAAHFAEGLVRDALRDQNFYVHQISARAKDPDSLLRKLRKKEYDDPATELTDQIAVRVITYYLDQVDPIVEHLTKSFIVGSQPVDKRRELNVREFGYRSVHLVVQARLKGMEGPTAEPLRDRWFEIQVRSILEHAWAEIEHEVVYKSGVDYPDDVLREFAAIAAQLEVLDQRFLALRQEEANLAQVHRGSYEEGAELDEVLDAARLSGLMLVARPDGFSFQDLTEQGASLPVHVEACCVEALRAAGIENARDLLEALQADSVLERIEGYASLQGIVSDEVSHFAVCVLVAAGGDPELFISDYADLLGDPDLTEDCLALTHQSGGAPCLTGCL
jgi:ppGpp synthetase/RelA/SpoT-type nucleotidyltranferase